MARARTGIPIVVNRSAHDSTVSVFLTPGVLNNFLDVAGTVPTLNPNHLSTAELHKEHYYNNT